MFGVAEPDRVIASAYEVPGPADTLPVEAPAPTPPQKSALPPPGWHADPHRRHELRYWDGARWTDHVSDMGATTVDPV
jgi:hypothetical protein